ncbi:MAG: helix-turn-helix domain-containing protein [Cephaloticoccus sp.]
MLFPEDLPPLGERHVFFTEKTVPLRAMLGTVGHARATRPDYSWHGQKRGRAEFSLLQYTLTGRGRLRVGAVERDVLPGQAMLLHFPDDNHYWLPADSSEWSFLFVCLHGRELSRLWRIVESRLGPWATLAPDAPAVSVAVRLIGAALRGEIDSAFRASTFAYEQVMALAAEARTPRPTGTVNDAIERARIYAEQNVHLPLTVDALAGQAGLSRFHFSRLFAAQHGLPPAAWLVEQRVREAARLLRGTRLPLKDIAARCGFPNENYLCRVFRRHSGMPPGSYRRSGA